jgi:hypothetical protein
MALEMKWHRAKHRSDLVLNRLAYFDLQLSQRLTPDIGGPDVMILDTPVLDTKLFMGTQ